MRYKYDQHRCVDQNKTALQYAKNHANWFRHRVSVSCLMNYILLVFYLYCILYLYCIS